MIPYWPPPVFHIGALEVRGFGVAVCLAILVGHSVAVRRARTLGLDARRISWFYAGGAAAAALAGHVWSVLAGESTAGPFQVWSGQSTAGVIAGILFGILFILWRRRSDGLRYVDALVFAFPFAWTLVRIGCFLAHDHIGARTESALGVRFPDGTRFDLGLLEALLALLTSVCLVLFARRFKVPGQLFGFLLLLAGAARVAVSAASESGLTTRVGGIVLGVVGAAVVVWLRTGRHAGGTLAYRLRHARPVTDSQTRSACAAGDTGS